MTLPVEITRRDASSVREVREYGLIDTLTCGLPPHLLGRRMVVTIKAFFDDSGSHGGPRGSKVCVVAGPVARVKRWHGFYKAWQRALHASPSIGYFKMNEAVTLKGEFSAANGWTEDMVHRKVQVLTQALVLSVDAHLVAAVNMSNYDAIVRGKTPDGWDYPYLPCFYHALGTACEHMERACPDGRLVVVFDRQRECEPQALSFFNTLKDAPASVNKSIRYLYNKHLGTIAFADDEDEVALQAADLIAWHYRVEASNEWSNEKTGEVFNKIGSLPVIGSVWGETPLQAWVDGLPKFASGEFRDSFGKPGS
jgi:hypothetical protein